MIPPLFKSKVLVGTPNFLAPEVISGFYDKKADVWSAGVILFLLRFGYPPFFCMYEQINQFADDNQDLYDKILKGFENTTKPGLGPWFPQEIKCSQSLKSLIASMLNKNLAQRPTIAECLEHDFFKADASEEMLPYTIIEAFTKFSGECRFKVMISHLFSHQITSGQRNSIKKVWKMFDIDGDGKITLEEFKEIMKKFGNYGYKDYQIETMFENLDIKDKHAIDLDSLIAAYSYQRLVAVDERMWEAFQILDVDGDGQITGKEIQAVLDQVTLEGKQQDDDTKKLISKTIKSMRNLDKQQHHLTKTRGPSLFIGDADFDENGAIDYEEFLRSLHPTFNEAPITPRNIYDDTNNDNDLYVDIDDYMPNNDNNNNNNKGVFKFDANNCDDEIVSANTLSLPSPNYEDTSDMLTKHVAKSTNNLKLMVDELMDEPNLLAVSQSSNK